MITKDGYSKDPTIRPEGIAVTFGKDMIADKGGLLPFIRWFESCFNTDEGTWMHKCKNQPKNDNCLLYVYIIIHNRVYYRCYYGGYRKGVTSGFLIPEGPTEIITWSRIILAGPLEKAPRKIYRSGFQGFRYTTKLF